MTGSDEQLWKHASGGPSGMANVGEGAPIFSVGVLFILVVITSLASGLAWSAVTAADPAEDRSQVMLDIGENPAMLHISIVGWLLTAIGIIVLAIGLYLTLKPYDPVLALAACGLWFAEGVTLAVSQMSAFNLLTVSGAFAGATGQQASHLQTLGSLYLQSTDFMMDVHMLFYTVGGMMFYYLFLRSALVPKLLSLFGMIAAGLGFIGMVFVLFGAVVPIVVFIPILPFEVAIGIWLMTRGANRSWGQATGSVQSNAVPKSAPLGAVEDGGTR